MCIASKINTAVRITLEAVNEGKSVVIGLQSTGEAQAAKNSSDQSEDAISSTCLGVLNDVMNYLPNFADEFRKVSNYLGYNDDEYDENDDDDDYDFNELKRSKKKFKAAPILMESELKSRDKDILKLKNDFEEIKKDFKSLKSILPANSLDQLIDDLGGKIFFNYCKYFFY